MSKELTNVAVATASPTMSKVSRNILLSLAACLKLIVRAGDVTGAFLQTGRPFRLGTPETECSVRS